MENYDCRFFTSFNGIDAGRIRLNSDGLRDATLMRVQGLLVVYMQLPSKQMVKL
jgi:hypothetical protein